MTMADHHNHTNGPTTTPDHSPSSGHHSVDPKKRKRKRLLQVLDKLHHNSTNMSHEMDTNSNSILVNNNNILATNHRNDGDDDKANYSTNLTRSVQENAEILRNLFALSRSLPATDIQPAFPSPSSHYECNNNNLNCATSAAASSMLNGKVKMEIKEETMDNEEDEANCSSVRDDTKTPLQEFLYLLPDHQQHHFLHHGHHPQSQQNGPQPNDILYQHHNRTPEQEFPLDLSMKSTKKINRRKQSSNSNSSSPNLTKQLLMAQAEQKLNAVLHPLGIQVPRDCSISIQTTPTSDSSSPHHNNHYHHQLPQYYQDMKVSPIVEEVAPGSNNVAYVCPICLQSFSLNDRLAKHIASRHKTRSPATESTKSYICEVCDRSFARSDMLTRHMRLHTGIKPYTCLTCGQVFSRSDHLSTHQRTHTGEKPYRCPQCNYAACRRDMITRHMRTHARYEQNNGNPPPRKVMKVESKKVKIENDVQKLSTSNINNNNDISMFNQNNLDKINELRMKIQENLMANGGLVVPNEIANLNREIKIEF